MVRKLGLIFTLVLVATVICSSNYLQSMAVIEVRKKYEAWLLTIPGVVGVSATPHEIIVYVESEQVIPRLPKQLEGVPVVPRVVGKIVLV